MLYPTAFALVLCLCGFAAGQDPPPTPPAPPPPAPAEPVAPPPPAPAEPAAPPVVPPSQRGGSDFPDAGLSGLSGPSGPPTPLPELMARTPDVVRLSTLLGAEVLDLGSRSEAILHDFVARKDGRLVALIALPGDRLVGVPLSGMVARAKPDLEGGSEEVTIRSFKLTRASRSLDAAPEVEDESKLGDAWLAKLDAGTPDAPAAPVMETAPTTPAAPTSPDAPGAPDAPAAPGTPAAPETPAAPGTPDAPDEPAADPDATPAPSDATPMPLLGALLGRTALDPAGQPLGTIVDVVIDVPNARIAYLLVLPHQSANRLSEVRAVAFEALGPDGNEDGVPLTISARTLAASPPIHGQGRLPVDPFAPPPVGSAQEPR